MTELKYKGYKVENVAGGKADFYVYTDLCKGCGLCIAKCPKQCLKWSSETGLFQTPAVEPDPAACIGCNACALICPDSAIRIERK